MNIYLRHDFLRALLLVESSFRRLRKTERFSLGNRASISPIEDQSVVGDHVLQFLLQLAEVLILLIFFPNIGLVLHRSELCIGLALVQHARVYIGALRHG